MQGTQTPDGCTRASTAQNTAGTKESSHRRLHWHVCIRNSTNPSGNTNATKTRGIHVRMDNRRTLIAQAYQHEFKECTAQLQLRPPHGLSDHMSVEVQPKDRSHLSDLRLTIKTRDLKPSNRLAMRTYLQEVNTHTLAGNARGCALL